MEQVEMNNMYINIGVNNGSEKCTKKHCGGVLIVRPSMENGIEIINYRQGLYR